MCFTREKQIIFEKIAIQTLQMFRLSEFLHFVKKNIRLSDRIFSLYEGENETYIEASVENSSSILYDKEIRNKPRTRRTKRNV